MALLCADNEIVGVLQKLKRFPEDLQQKGLEYIPDDRKEWFQEELAKTKKQIDETDAVLVKERQALSLLPVAPGQPSESDLAEAQTIQSLFNAKFPHLA